MESAIEKKHWLFARQTGLSVNAPVDDEPATLGNVSLLTAGEAIGHGILIDETTLDQTAEALKGKKLRSYITHDGAMGGDRLTREAGTFSGIKRDGDQVKAKLFRPFKAFAKHNAAQYDALFELAAEMPEDWGVSIVPGGYAAWPMKDGSEVPYRYGDDKPDGALNDKPSLRVTEVFSADFVDAPAANAGGLFRAGTNENQIKGDHIMADENAATKEALALSKQVSDLKDEVVDLKTQLKAKADELAKAATDAAVQLQAVNDEHANALKGERERISEVLKLGKEHKEDALAYQAIEKGTGVDVFQAELLAAYKNKLDAGKQAPGVPNGADAVRAAFTIIKGDK